MAPTQREAHRRHAEHYLLILSSAEALFDRGGEHVVTGLVEFDLERENILLGQNWAVNHIWDNPETMQLYKKYALSDMNIYFLRLHPKELISILDATLDVVRRLSDYESEGKTLINLGSAHHLLGNVNRAIEFHEQALVIARETGNRRREGSALEGLGIAFATLGNAHKALEYFEHQLLIAREIGNRSSEGSGLRNLGIACIALGEISKAIEYYDRALLVAREIDDRGAEGSTLGSLGNAYEKLGDARKAIEFHEQALAIAHAMGDRRRQGKIVGNLGNSYSNLGDIPKAIDFYHEALTISREIGDRHGEMGDLANLGNAYDDLGEPHQAIAFYEQSLIIAREIGDRRTQGSILGNLGFAYTNLSQAQKAIEYYREALTIAREIGDRRGEIIRLGNLGRTYALFDEKASALSCIEHLEKLARPQDNNYILYASIANIYLDLDFQNEACETFTKAIEAAPSAGILYRNRATAFIRLENWQAALDDIAQAELLEPKHPFLPVRKGDYFLWKREFAEAINWYRQALEKAKSSDTYFMLGMAFLGIEDERSAKNQFELGLEHTDISVIKKIVKELERAKAILPHPNKVEEFVSWLREKI